MPEIRKKVTVSFLILLWILAFALLLYTSTNSELNTLYQNFDEHKPVFSLGKNEIRGLSRTKCDPEENGRPVYSVYFESLCAQNNKFGFFKTGLHKVVKIRDLRLKFYRYSCNQSEKAAAACVNESREFRIRDIFVEQEAAKDILDTRRENRVSSIENRDGLISRVLNPMQGWRVDIDLSNVTEVRVSNFDYRVFDNGDLFFAVQGKRALASYKRPDVILRGHVIITAADGGRLECNYAKWDIEKEYFKIDGIYVLNRSGLTTAGKDICVDSQLNNVKAQHAKSEQKEAEKCFAKL